MGEISVGQFSWGSGNYLIHIGTISITGLLFNQIQSQSSGQVR